MAIPQTPKHSL